MKITLPLIALVMAAAVPGFAYAQATVDCRGNSQAKPCVEFRENGYYDGPFQIITDQPKVSSIEETEKKVSSDDADRFGENFRYQLADMKCKPVSEFAWDLAAEMYMHGKDGVDDLIDLALPNLSSRTDAMMIASLAAPAKNILFWGDPKARINEFSERVYAVCIEGYNTGMKSRPQVK